MWEAACERVGTCNVDQRSFKAYLARWMAHTAVKAPFTYPVLKPILEASAMAAISTCTGGNDGNQCGLRWWAGSHDGEIGVGEQMSVLEVVQSNLIDLAPGPATADNGGTSQGDVNAGQGSDIGPDDLHTSRVTAGDRTGAAILTILFAVLFVGGAWWIVV
jgi:mannan endo-1,6-alpha-mannosidase